MVSVDELWLTDFGVPYPSEPAHHRPALTIGPPAMFGAAFPFVIVVPLTTKRRRLSLHVEVEASSLTGLDEVSYAQCELIRSINADRLVHRLGHVDLVTSQAVHTIIKTLLGH